MDKLNRPDWDILFISLAFLIAQRSPDAETKHGAVLVDGQKRIIGLGFNGFPRGAKDFELPNTRPDKYPFILHAEANCLDNCIEIKNPQDCTMYITGESCIECTKRIIQAGIGKVITGNVSSNCMKVDEKYQQNLNRIKAMTKTQFILLKPEKINIYKNEVKSLFDITLEYINNRLI